MPTHNRVELLKKAIDSVLAQSYQNFKLVIVDDGSSDGTQAYLLSLTDPRISVIRHDVAQGACYSRNEAIAQLDTELVTGLDDDDSFLPHRLADLLAVYNENYSFVCSGYYWNYGAHKKVLFNNNRKISLSDAFDLNQCSNQILVRRDKILAVGGFDEKIPALQDQDLWVRLIAKYGIAYRIGKPSYIVNDDHSLERISSVQNKLRAIEMFEQKHKDIMLPRNKANFAFYKQKIKGGNFSLFDFVRSTRHGLFALKSRYYLSKYFKTASQARLNYLRTGDAFEWSTWFIDKFVPLLATGGPGASRVILLSACIFFLGATDSSSFSGDFFIIMLLNTAFSQCFGFFLLKQEYQQSFASITKQSLYGLSGALVFALIFALIGLISQLYYSLWLIVILHFYYLYRFKNIAEQYFIPLAITEVLISLLCIFLPFVAGVYQYSGEHVPYLVYIIATLVGLILVSVFSKNSLSNKMPFNNPIFKEKLFIPFRNLRNISISTTASIFAIFILPASIKAIASPEIVSIVALTISCISISMLIPRTYANKIMKNLSNKELKYEDFFKLNQYYIRLMLMSAFAGLCFSIGYLYLINPQFGEVIILISLAICCVLVTAQLGFISLTFLSLQGADQVVAKMNLIVLLTTALVAIPAMSGLFTMQYIIYIIVFVAAISFVIRNKLAMQKVVHYIK
jgi:glycosyltransferase involved in cell wall biosynthesis